MSRSGARGPVWAVEADFIKATCPWCLRHIYKPYSRYSGPVVDVHQAAGCGGKLLVRPDAVGSAHLVERVLPHESLEVALSRALRDQGTAA